MVVEQICEYRKIYWTIYFEMVKFMLCELELNTHTPTNSIKKQNQWCQSRSILPPSGGHSRHVGSGSLTYAALWPLNLSKHLLPQPLFQNFLKGKQDLQWSPSGWLWLWFICKCRSLQQNPSGPQYVAKVRGIDLEMESSGLKYPLGCLQAMWHWLSISLLHLSFLVNKTNTIPPASRDC